MGSLFLGFKQRNSLPSSQPYFLSQPIPPPPPNIQSDIFNLNNRVSPSILLIIIILAIIFFVSGLLHLLIRFLMRPQNRDPDDLESVTALQGQLQQLFHLHDAGVDQSFIDTLPVFNYKAIIGLKNPFDCAVCLCEFEPEDKLRLLPKCSHAFHMECIDTWLLSHSTCPLCRASLLPDFSPNHNCSPIVFVLESGSESSREIVSEAALGRTSSVLGSHHFSELGSTRIDLLHKSCEFAAKEDEASPKEMVGSDEKVVTVKLGKLRNVDGGVGGEGSSNNKVDARRCFSMGSFEYVMDENSSLQVPISTKIKKQPSKKRALPLTPGHRTAISECDCESRREFKFNAFEAIRDVEHCEGASIGKGDAVRGNKRESFSVSKIWLRGKKEKSNAAAAAADTSRRAVSFRFPVQQSVVDAEDLKAKNGDCCGRRSISEIDIGMWENGGSELGCDGERQSSNSLDSQISNTPSFARRTLLWLMGKQNKVVHSSEAPTV
ncbi:RING-H2 finger protein ATL13 [Corylus avellana]|uniref:RING-H2 finger protein ATL13 n=1 Tax=Corylus avellana TaxID=13451 RepID=UPI00286A9186|nr:RING-H2 finger protein ATL13 [Corylus avellana]